MASDLISRKELLELYEGLDGQGLKVPVEVVVQNIKDQLTVDAVEGNRLQIDLQDNNFGAILNCAIRYCIGRRTYMPGLVVNYIRPLLPYLSKRTVQVMWNDIRSAKSYGDPCDEVTWMNFLQDLVAELDRRDGEEDGSTKK